MREDVLYVLRLWRDSDRENCWRASLENIRTGSRQAFSSPTALNRFIASETDGEDEPGGG
ncbi:MAG: hypothetical protein WD314_07650 [Trueperaceae bacterium]